MKAEGNKYQYLTFLIDKKCYGIEVKYVTEIVSMQGITVVPEMPHYIKGIMNLRGMIIPIMDVRLRFNLEEKAYTERSCIIVLDIDGIDIGIVIDQIAEVITIEDYDLINLPEGYATYNEFVKCIVELDNQIKALIDCKKLIEFSNN